MLFAPSFPYTQVIHEQQLGWDWRPPDDALFNPVHSAAAENKGAEGGAAEEGVTEEEASAMRAAQELHERLQVRDYAML